MKFKKNYNGFTLIEILIVFGVIAFITISLLANEWGGRVYMDEVLRVVMADIRQAQANALSVKTYFNPITGLNEHRCGYGVVQNDNSSYFIYVGRPTAGSGCPSSWKYNASQDTIVVFTRVLDPRLEIYDPNGNPKPNFEDITFEPVTGSIRIDNQHQPNNANLNRSQIVIRKINATCPSVDCIYICVYSFGLIENRNNSCPSLP